MFIFFFQAEDGIRDGHVTGVQTCALPISENTGRKSAAGARSSKMAGWKKCSQSHYRPRTDDQFCCQIKVKIMHYQSFRLFFLLNMVLLPMLVYSQVLYGDYIEQSQKIAQRLIITDGHVDFPYRFRSILGEITAENQEYAIRFPRAEFDYEKAKEGGLDAPFMSAYIPASYQNKDGGRALADSLIAFVEWMIEAYPDW